MAYKLDGRGGMLFKPETPSQQAALSRLEKTPISGSLYFKIRDTLVHRVALDIPSKYDSNEYKVEDEVLKEFQIETVEFMVNKPNSLVGDEMGLGKTVEFVRYCRVNEAKRGVIIVPKTIILQWKKKFREFWPECPSVVETRPKRARDGFNITNPANLLDRAVLESYKRYRWDVLAIDEAQTIKNRKSKISENVCDLPGAKRIAMTGTPIMSRTQDLWHILHWIDYNIPGTYNCFCKYFCKWDENEYGSTPVGLTEDPFFVDLLQRVLDKVMIRHTRKQVLGTKKMPPNEVTLEMSPRQRKLYRDIQKLVLEELPEGCTIANAMAQSLRLMQVTSDPELWLERCGNPKFEYIFEWLDQNPTRKLLVFSRFKQTILRLNSHLESEGICYATIHGDIEGGYDESVESDRDIEKEKFIKQPWCRVMTGTIGALGVGTDGLQYVCSDEIFIDRMWNPGENDQAEDRLDRHGQKEAVTVTTLSMKGTIDKHVGNIVIGKAEDIKRLFKEEDDD